VGECVCLRVCCVSAFVQFCCIVSSFVFYFVLMWVCLLEFVVV